MPLKDRLRKLAADAGFELAGVCAVEPLPDAAWFQDWAARGLAGRMSYLSDHRARLREQPRQLLPAARSMLCVGKVYNGPEPHSPVIADGERGWIARYAWGDDYHRVMRQGLEAVAAGLRRECGFEYRICVDTAPLLERSYARMAGLGWIGRNTCLIHQRLGSWVFLAEMLLSLELEPDAPPPDRCGTCRRCIDACPTAAIVPGPRMEWELDARLCISYLTIELKGPIPEQQRAGIGKHLFGCDICQEVCPWNRKAPVADGGAFAARHFAPPLDRMAALTEAEFRDLFGDTPVDRARYRGFLRNVAVAMGNSGEARFREPLERLAASPDPGVAEHARWALAQLY